MPDLTTKQLQSGQKEHSALLERVYKRMLQESEVSQLRPEDFRDTYDDDKIKTDLAYVREMKQQFEKIVM